MKSRAGNNRTVPQDKNTLALYFLTARKQISASALVPLTEISQFEFSFLVDEQVLGLQVPVENFPLVTIRQPSQNLEQEDLERRVKLDVNILSYDRLDNCTSI